MFKKDDFCDDVLSYDTDDRKLDDEGTTHAYENIYDERMGIEVEVEEGDTAENVGKSTKNFWLGCWKC